MHFSPDTAGLRNKNTMISLREGRLSGESNIIFIALLLILAKDILEARFTTGHYSSPFLRFSSRRRHSPAVVLRGASHFSPLLRRARPPAHLLLLGLFETLISSFSM